MNYFACLALFLLITTTAVAQVPTSDEPGRETARFARPTQPLSRPSGTISLPGVVAPEGAGAITLRVSDIRVVGASIYSSGDLANFWQSLVGREAVLAEIYDLAQKLTAKYGADGYVLSRAIVPPQELDPAGAVVTIQIVEGYVDRVEWPAQTARYRDFFSDYAAKITAERPVNISTVMRYLLLAGDLPGIDVTSRFQASETNPNASTLIVEVTEKAIDAFAQVDNRGTEARGPWQHSTSVTLNNALGLYEAFTFGFSGAFELTELQHLNLGYKQVLNSEGLFVFSNTTASWGEPGTEALQALDFTTQSFAFDLGLGLSVVRSRDANLTFSALAFLSDNEGEMLGAPSSDDRLRGIRLKTDFDFADELRGITQGNITFSQGFEAFGSTLNGDPLASRDNGRVDFTTLAASISRLQPLDHGLSFQLAANGQIAFTPLLSPEECGYGGRSFGRAFDPSEITGDSCFAVSAEARFDPDLPGNPLDQTQFYAFADYGAVFRIAPAPGTPTSQDGASAGIGLRLGTKNFTVDLSAAKPLFGRIDDGWRGFVSLALHN